VDYRGGELKKKKSIRGRVIFKGFYFRNVKMNVIEGEEGGDCIENVGKVGSHTGTDAC